MGESEYQAVVEVLRTGMLVQGPRVAAFEQAAQQWLSPGHQAVAVSNGTAALHLALVSLSIGLGDAVLLPTYSWPATANVVELVGAQPVFVDIDSRTYNLCPNDLSYRIENCRDRKNLKAVMVVHAFGFMAEMEAITKVAAAHNLLVIEDAACALGSAWRGQAAGTIGHIGCFSLHPRKVITTGEGGLVASTNSEIARRLRALRNHGLDPEANTPDFIMAGFNYRMTDFQAALGITQLKRLAGLISRRRQLAELYNSLFAATPVTPQQCLAESLSNYQSYVVLLPNGCHRNSIIEQLATSGIASNIGTYHIPLTSYYRNKYGFKPGDFPVTDALSERSLALPLHNDMSERDVRNVAETLIAAIQKQY